MLNTNVNYEIVGNNNEIFNNIVENAWKEINATTENFKDSDKLLVKNANGEAIGTIEFANYNLGFENTTIENTFSFSKYQSNDVNLIYIDKLAIDKKHRSNIENMKLLMLTVLNYTLSIEPGKKVVFVALIQSKFYKFFKHLTNFKIDELSAPINGEIPILFDLEKNMEIIKSGKWSKINL